MQPLGLISATMLMGISMGLLETLTPISSRDLIFLSWVITNIVILLLVIRENIGTSTT